MKHAVKFLIVAALVLAAAPAFAQAKSRPTRLAATVESFDHGMLMVKTDMGQEAMVDVTPKTKISGVAVRKLSDIKPNDFIGVTAVQAGDGKLHAIEVHIFPAAARGTGEGHHPMGRPDTTMTNAVVSGIVKSGSGADFTLSYKDPKTGKTGEVQIDIGPTVPIVLFVPGDPSLLKPGARAIIFGPKNADGSYTAFAIVAEKDGVKPPM